MSYLLAVTVGPVQTYIEESQKLRDLYNSSKIISDIIKKIKNSILEEFTESHIIYPNHGDINNMDYSNYVVFELDKLISMKKIEIQIFKSKEFEGLKEAVHLFWTIEELEKDNYVGCYNKLTKRLMDLKNTYEFKQEEQESGKKCLLCNKRNKEKSKRNKHLCKACLKKRNYIRAQEMTNSVYSIAIKYWKIKNEEILKDLTQDMKKVFKDSDKYYKSEDIKDGIRIMQYQRNKQEYEDFIDEINEGLSTGDIIKNLKMIEQKMSVIYEAKGSSQKIEVPQYRYCFIQFDIDDLGRWMSGEYLAEKDNLKDYQKMISHKLIVFGNELKNRLKNTNCTIIYSGGDDFLGVVPLEEMLMIIEIIKDVFEEYIKIPFSKDIDIEENMTYSLSSTIVRCNDPMSYALGKSRLELDEVKKRPWNSRKNGIVLNYLINAGKNVTAYIKQESFLLYIELIKKYKLLSEGTTFTYIDSFEKELSKFSYSNLTWEEVDNISQIAKYEMKRLIKRSTKKKSLELGKYVNEIIDFLMKIMSENIIDKGSNQYYIDFSNIVNIFRLYEKLSKIDFKIDQLEGGCQNEGCQNEDSQNSSL